MAATDRLLKKLVQNALISESERITSKIGNSQTLEQLRGLGYVASVDGGEDRLMPQAFEAVFDGFPEARPPSEVQQRVDELGLIGVRWKVAQGIITENRAQPLKGIIFIRDPNRARLSSWFHELGHVLFHLGEEGSFLPDRHGVNRDLAARLAAAAKSEYPIVASLASPPIPGERCIRFSNGHSYGFTHHGPEGEVEELWAILFGEQSAGLELHPRVKAHVEEIILKLMLG